MDKATNRLLLAASVLMVLLGIPGIVWTVSMLGSLLSDPVLFLRYTDLHEILPALCYLAALPAGIFGIRLRGDARPRVCLALACAMTALMAFGLLAAAAAQSAADFSAGYVSKYLSYMFPPAVLLVHYFVGIIRAKELRSGPDKAAVRSRALLIAGVKLAVLGLPGMFFAWKNGTLAAFDVDFTYMSIDGVIAVGCYGFAAAAGLAAILLRRERYSPTCRVLGVLLAAFLALGAAVSLICNPGWLFLYGETVQPLLALTPLYLACAWLPLILDQREERRK